MALFTPTPRKDEPGAQPEPKSGPSVTVFNGMQWISDNYQILDDV